MKKKIPAKPKIVCFGGGRAMPDTVLAGLKAYPVEITSITSMTDSGGSTGQLRADFGVLPPGDIRRHLLALSFAPVWKKELFALKFGHEDFGAGHKGHTFGNIFIAGLERVLGDYEKVLGIVHEFLDVRGRCLPATIENTALSATLENGISIFGEDEIDIAKKHDPCMRISGIYLDPQVRAYPPAVAAIKSADLIVIGPGDMYSSILPCFLPRGIKDAIRGAKAKKVFICPAMTKLGETRQFFAEDFAKEAEKYIGCGLDKVIFNSKAPGKKRMRQYKKNEPQLLELVVYGQSFANSKFIGRKLLAKSGGIVYDPEKVADALMKLI